MRKRERKNKSEARDKSYNRLVKFCLWITIK